MPEVGTVSAYREVADRLKHFIVDRSATLAPNQDILPMWELIGRNKGDDVLVADPDGAAASIMPTLVKQEGAAIVAHIMFAWWRKPADGERREVAMVAVIDSDRVELWTAPIIRSERSPIIGPWECFGGSDPTAAVGGPVPEIQAALR